MIELNRLQEIVKLMSENDLSEINLRDGEEEVRIRRGSVPAAATAQQIAAPAYSIPLQPTTPQGSAPAAAAQAANAAPAGLIAIESPMVGTFYSAPNPDTPAFVKPGSSISPESVVCLIEAMKVFNEIKAEKTGVIEQVLAKNGEAVEFGQKLFLVRPM